MSQRKRNRNNAGETGTEGEEENNESEDGGNSEGNGGGNDRLNNVLTQLTIAIRSMNQPAARQYNVASCRRFLGYDGKDPTE